MKKEPSDKLEGINTHDFHFIVTGVVFVTKKHLIILNLDNAMVPYCYPVSISTEVFNNILRFSERGFTVYHPLFGKKFVYQLLKVWFFIQMFDGTRKLQFIRRISFFQVCKKLIPEPCRENFRLPWGDNPPPVTIQWIWGWSMRFCPHVCKMLINPIRAPR